MNMPVPYFLTNIAIMPHMPEKKCFFGCQPVHLTVQEYIEDQWNAVLQAKTHAYTGKAVVFARENDLDISNFKPTIDMMDDPVFKQLKNRQPLVVTQSASHSTCHFQTHAYQTVQWAAPYTNTQTFAQQENRPPTPLPDHSSNHNGFFNTTQSTSRNTMLDPQQHLLQIKDNPSATTTSIIPPNGQPASFTQRPPLSSTNSRGQHSNRIKVGGSAFDMSHINGELGQNKGRAQATIKKTATAEKGLYAFVQAAVCNTSVHPSLRQQLMKLNLADPHGLALLYHKEPVATADIVCSWLRCMRNGKKGADGQFLKVTTLAGKVQRLQAVIGDQLADAVRRGIISPELAPTKVILSAEGHHLWGRVYSTLDELGREYTKAGGDAYRKQAKVITPELEVRAQELGTFDLSTPKGIPSCSSLHWHVKPGCEHLCHL